MLPPLPVKIISAPSQTGLLLLAVATGLAKTTTSVVPTAEQPNGSVTVTEYVPL